MVCSSNRLIYSTLAGLSPSSSVENGTLLWSPQFNDSTVTQLSSRKNIVVDLLSDLPAINKSRYFAHLFE